jgi:hypothetical protein
MSANIQAPTPLLTLPAISATLHLCVSTNHPPASPRRHPPTHPIGITHEEDAQEGLDAGAGQAPRSAVQEGCLGVQDRL